MARRQYRSVFTYGDFRRDFGFLMDFFKHQPSEYAGDNTEQYTTVVTAPPSTESAAEPETTEATSTETNHAAVANGSRLLPPEVESGTWSPTTEDVQGTGGDWNAAGWPKFGEIFGGAAGWPKFGEIFGGAAGWPDFGAIFGPPKSHGK